MINKLKGIFYRVVGFILSITLGTVFFILHPIESIKTIKEERRIKRTGYRGCGKGFYYTDNTEVDNGNTVL